jgi:hypothetical protein
MSGEMLLRGEGLLLDGGEDVAGIEAAMSFWACASKSTIKPTSIRNTKEINFACIFMLPSISRLVAKRCFEDLLQRARYLFTQWKSCEAMLRILHFSLFFEKDDDFFRILHDGVAYSVPRPLTAISILLTGWRSE